jgi:hypothetical protein
LKHLAFVIFIAALISSCSTEKFASEATPENSKISQQTPKFRSLSSTVKVEVRDDLDTEVLRTENTEQKSGKSNTAVVTVVPCDQIASETKRELSIDRETVSLDRRLKSASTYKHVLDDLRGTLLQSEAAQNVKIPWIHPLKSVKQLKKLRKRSNITREDKKTGNVVYIILVILLVLIVIRLLEVLTGPILDLLLLALIIFIVGRLLNFW